LTSPPTILPVFLSYLKLKTSGFTLDEPTCALLGYVLLSKVMPPVYSLLVISYVAALATLIRLQPKATAIAKANLVFVKLFLLLLIFVHLLTQNKTEWRQEL